MLVKVARGYVNTDAITFIEEHDDDTITVRFDGNRAMRLNEQDSCHVMFLLEPKFMETKAILDRDRFIREDDRRIAAQYTEGKR